MTVQEMAQQEMYRRRVADRALLVKRKRPRRTPRGLSVAAEKRRRTTLNPRVQFADWLKRKMPEVWAVAEEAAVNQAERLDAMQAGVYGGEQLGGWFADFFTAPVQTVKEATTATATAVKSTWEKLLDGAIAGGTAYLTYQNQKDMLALNIERAKMGLPPLDAGATAPVIKTQVDIAPELADKLVSNLGSSINRNMMLFGAIAIGALIFFGMRK